MNKPLRRIELYHIVGGKRILGPNPKMTGNCSGLAGDCTGLKGDCSGLSGDCSDLIGDCSRLWGDCSGLKGDCSGLRGYCTGLIGNLSLIPLEERKDNPYLSYWVNEAETTNQPKGE